MKINTKFNIKDKVKITELKREGKITSIYISETGIQYNVRFFEGADVKTVYFYEDELKEPEKEEILGFKIKT